MDRDFNQKMDSNKKKNITQALVNEHRLILRMITLLERNAARTAGGSYSNWQFYIDGIDFIRSYADRFHHAKEEDILFEALVRNGMPRENSPIAAMLMEHDQGRAFVKGMEAAALEAIAGQTGRKQIIADNALAYAALLREHIAKEDEILYPLAERVIPDTMRDEIVAGYAAAEARTETDFSARYEAAVAGYEQEKLY
jgi:hemerythrin-like domain-containing protein